MGWVVGRDMGWVGVGGDGVHGGVGVVGEFMGWVHILTHP